MNLLGQLLTAIGAIGWLTAIALGNNFHWDWAQRALILFVASAAFGLAVFLKNRAKRLVAIDVATARKRDPRPPVVYLRQFIADDRMDVESVFGVDSSLEQSLVRVLSAIGPVIALTRPGERLPPPGAARQAASNEEWQQVIEGWLREAKLVVLIAGSSENVSWEIGRCRQILRPEQLVVVVPAGLPWDKFRAATEPQFGVTLPAQLGDSGILAFGPDFTPAFLPDTTTRLQRANRMGNAHVLFQQNLLPVFEKLGIAAERPSALTPTFRVILVVGAILLALAAMCITYSMYEVRHRPDVLPPSAYQ